MNADPPLPANEAAINAISALRQEFTAAENRGDPSVQLDARHPDAFRRMPPGSPPLGPEEAAESLTTLYATGDVSVSWESDGVIATETLAVDSGSFSVLTPDDESPRHGSWLMVFVATRDGEWLVVRDIYNWDTDDH